MAESLTALTQLRVHVDSKGHDVRAAARAIKDILQVGAKRLGKGTAMVVEAEDEEHGLLRISTNLPTGSIQDAVDKARSKIASSRGWNIKTQVEELGAPPAPVPAPPMVVKDQAWVERQVEKRVRDAEDAFTLQTQRQDAAIKSLESQVASLAQAKTRVEREKEESERARKAVEAQQEVLLKNLLSFADDPSKAALQVVSRAASWIRHLENQMKEAGEQPVGKSLDEFFSVARQDLLTYANSILAESGQAVRTVEELRALADPTPWEQSEFHRTHSTDYLKAKEELEFVNGVRSGTIRVPESVRELVLAGIATTPRETVVEEYETKHDEHSGRRAAGNLATTAADVHSYSVRLMELVRSRAEKDPIPIAMVFRSEDGGSQIEMHIPAGLAEGPISAYLESTIRDVASTSGFTLQRHEEAGTDQMYLLVPDRPDSHREEVLRMQGEFHAALAERFASSSLRGAEVGFRILDIRDIVV